MCTGQFKPGPGATPTIGSIGAVEYVEEDRVELVVNDKGQKVELKEAINELKTVTYKLYTVFVSNLTFTFQVHPYEEVAYHVHRLEDI
jgi:hypothetical protein